MALREEFETSGQWLFRWRGYLPLFAIALTLFGLWQARDLPVISMANQIWEVVGIVSAIAGLLIRAHVVGHAPHNTSGRNARAQRADQLNSTGMYSVVRHPLYLGNFLVFIGAIVFAHLPWITAICVLAFWLYYERIMFAEEAYLRQKFGESYEQWALHTPAFIPNIRNWQPASLSFSLRNVLRREYNNVFGVLLVMALFKSDESFFTTGEFSPGFAWTLTLAVGGCCWLLLRTLKRNTEWLRVEGR